MTYRLMAEMAADVVCRKLGVHAECRTHKTPIPGSEGGALEKVAKKIWEIPTMVQKASVGRIGSRAASLDFDDDKGSVVCECEEVSVSEIDEAIENLEVHDLVDLRRRTRFGMGTCQGELCACRAAGRLAKATECTSKARADLRGFMAERWKGMYPVAWGETLRESAFTQWVYSEVLGLNEDL